jgi:hypothetical protein
MPTLISFSDVYIENIGEENTAQFTVQSRPCYQCQDRFLTRRTVNLPSLFCSQKKDTMTPNEQHDASQAHIHSTLVAKQIYATLRTAIRTTPCRCSSSPEAPCETPIQSARQKHCRIRSPPKRGASTRPRSKARNGQAPNKAQSSVTSHDTTAESYGHRRHLAHYHMPFPRRAGAPVARRQARPLGKKAERKTSSSSDPPT